MMYDLDRYITPEALEAVCDLNYGGMHLSGLHARRVLIAALPYIVPDIEDTAYNRGYDDGLIRSAGIVTRAVEEVRRGSGERVD